MMTYEIPTFDGDKEMKFTNIEEAREEAKKVTPFHGDETMLQHMEDGKLVKVEFVKVN